MKTIDEFLQELINEQLEQGILSGNRGEGPSKDENTACAGKRAGSLSGYRNIRNKGVSPKLFLKELIPYLKRSLQNDFCTVAR